MVGVGGDTASGVGGIGVKGTGGPTNGTGVEGIGIGTGVGIKAISSTTGSALETQSTVVTAASSTSPASVRHKDLDGNIRSTVDHNGYPAMGDFSYYHDSFIWLHNAGSISGASFGNLDNPYWYLDQTANTVAASSNNGSLMGYSVGHVAAAINNRSAIKTRQALGGGIYSYTVMVAEWWSWQGTLASNGNCTQRMGFSSSYNAGSALEGAFFYRQGNGTWHANTVDSGLTGTDVDTGDAPLYNTPQKFRVEIYGSATGFGACCKFYINNVLMATITTHQPTSAMSFVFDIHCTGTPPGDTSLSVGSVKLAWNHQANSFEV